MFDPRQWFKKPVKQKEQTVTTEQLIKAGYVVCPRAPEFYVKYDGTGNITDLYGLVRSSTKEPKYKRIER